MTTRISSTRNRSTRVEVLGGALVLFERGIAELGEDVRPGVLAAAHRRGYLVSDDDPATPAPKRRTRAKRSSSSSSTPADPPAGDPPAGDPPPAGAGEQLADVDEDQADELAGAPE